MAEPVSDDDTVGEPGPQRAVLPRVVVYGLLVAVVAFTFFEATLWPLNSWQLFSYVRRPVTTSLVVTTHSADGPVALDASELWREYRGLTNALEQADRGRIEAVDVCAALLDEVRVERPEVDEVVIEELRTDRSIDGDAAERVLERDEIVRCAP